MSLQVSPHTLLDKIFTDPVCELIEQLHGVLPVPFVPSRGALTKSQSITPAHWEIAPIPLELTQRKVELVVSANDTQGLIQALHSGTDTIVLDFDDTFSPTWVNVAKAYRNLALLEFESFRPILVLRPRPLYLPEAHLKVNDGVAVAGLVDLSVYLYQHLYNQVEHGLYIYIPKLETVEEARLWNELLGVAERVLQIAPNTIRVGIQIETLAAASQAEELLFVFRNRAFGLNAGRWDYVFSLIKKLGKDTKYILPERERIQMDQPFLQAYEQTIVQTSHRYAAQAIGGSAALIPGDNPEPVLQIVAADKAREARQGFQAAWVGHPALVETVRKAFEAVQQVEPKPQPDLLNIQLAKTLDPDLVHDTLNLALIYLCGWLQGEGVLSRRGRTEDVATVELARTQLWQWVRHKVPLSGGGVFDEATYQTWREIGVMAMVSPTAQLAGRLLDQMVLSENCPDYFTLLAYPYLIKLEEAAST